MFFIRQFLLQYVILLNIKVIEATANHSLGYENVVEQVRVVEDKEIFINQLRYYTLVSMYF